MSKSMIKPFAVMVVGVIALGFLVSTAFNRFIFAEEANYVQINLIDNSTTKNLSLCVNNNFVTLNNGIYKTNPGLIDTKVYYGDLKGATTCSSADLNKNKMFEISKDLVAGQTLHITAEGTIVVSGKKELYKPVLLSTTNLPGILSQNTVSWKALDNTNVKYKDAICMNSFLIKEDSLGSRKSTIIHGNRSFTFDFKRNGDFCTANSTDPNTKLVLDIKCGCEGAKLYELGVETIIDESDIYYTGLTFTTKITKKEVVNPPLPETPVTPNLPNPEIVPLTPKPVQEGTQVIEEVAKEKNPALPELAQAQVITVRSGGHNTVLFAIMIAGIISMAYLATRTKKLHIS